MEESETTAQQSPNDRSTPPRNQQILQPSTKLPPERANNPQRRLVPACVGLGLRGAPARRAIVPLRVAVSRKRDSELGFAAERAAVGHLRYVTA